MDERELLQSWPETCGELLSLLKETWVLDDTMRWGRAVGGVPCEADPLVRGVVGMATERMGDVGGVGEYDDWDNRDGGVFVSDNAGVADPTVVTAAAAATVAGPTLDELAVPIVLALLEQDSC